MSFSVNSSSTINSVSWDFGDGKTSNLTNPFHRFDKAGTYDVKASVTFAGGGTCDTTKEIIVYNQPEMDVHLDPANNYCLTQNQICLFDSTTSGNSGVTISQRTILWGDGDKTDTQNPQHGDKTCHTYAHNGNFTITIESVNDKGCKAIQEIDITILFDFVPTFTYFKYEEGCDSQTYEFHMDTSWFKFNGLFSKLEYEFDNGSRQTVSMGDTAYHTFRKTGSIPVKLHVTMNNGCVTTFQQILSIQLDEIVINHEKLDSILCWPDYFEFTHPIVPGLNTRYTWTAYNEEKKLLTAFGGSRTSFFFPDTPGKYYIALEIKRNECVSVMQFDSVESLGVKTDAMVLNGSQCAPEDTVYFLNLSKHYGSNDIEYLWNFTDTAAPPCTTDTKKNIDVDKNCNFSHDEHGKHFYKNEKCEEIWLTAVDRDNGCADSSRYSVLLGKPELDSFKYIVDRACIGSAPGYGVEFELKTCFGDVNINLDSACKRDSFVDMPDKHSYSKTCDTSGWVTLGVSAVAGDWKIYQSADTSDYIIDSTKICTDTMWFHKAFKVQKAPKPQFKYSFSGCIPSILSGSLFHRAQPTVRWMRFDWGDGEKDSIYIPIGTDSLPNFSHTYARSGVYLPVLTLETDSGCADYQRIERVVGFYNDYEFDDLICPGQTVFFKDTITYWDDTTQYWRDSLRPEKIFWEWDGAIGPAGGHQVKARFDTAGTYVVKMISMDNKMCRDTMTKTIVVDSVRAGIRNVDKKIICDDILQLFDSSRAVPHPRDSLVYYFWDFGDGKTPSFLKHPFHYYSTYGSFDVTHIVANTSGCTDTAYITIQIDGPLPEFDIVSDTVGCAPFTAEFQNNSTKSTEYIWYFGDSSSTANTLSTNADTNVSFTYNNPGVYYIYLYAGDSVVNPDNQNQIYFCSSIFPDTNSLSPPVRRIVVLPKPPVDFDVDGIACVNSTLTLTDQSDTAYSYYRWYLGSDSTVGSNAVQQITVKDTGELTIHYRPRYDAQPPYFKECFDTAVKTLQAYGVEVGFDFSKDTFCPTYHFTSISQDDAQLLWDFGHPNSGDLNQSNETNPSHQFAPDKGDFLVCLTATTPEGCVDSSCLTVNSDHAFGFFIPNVITPNGDGLNDNYEIELEGENFFRLSIFNRWGERVYYAEKDHGEFSGRNWDGTVQGTGLHCPPGTYYYILEFREGCVGGAEIEKYQGTITLIR